MQRACQGEHHADDAEMFQRWGSGLQPESSAPARGVRSRELDFSASLTTTATRGDAWTWPTGGCHLKTLSAWTKCDKGVSVVIALVGETRKTALETDWGPARGAHHGCLQGQGQGLTGAVMTERGVMAALVRRPPSLTAANLECDSAR